MVELGQDRGVYVILHDYPFGLDENAIMRSVADDRALPFVGQQATFEAHYYWNGGEPDLFSLDGTHPNDAGYGLMAENLYSVIVNSEVLASGNPGSRNPRTE